MLETDPHTEWAQARLKDIRDGKYDNVQKLLKFFANYLYQSKRFQGIITETADISLLDKTITLGGQGTPDIQVLTNSHWIERLPNQSMRNSNNWHYGDGSNFDRRISLNIDGDEQLIQKLDQFIIKHKMAYKMPTTAGEWAYRTDPITIYIHKGENLTAETMQELMDIIQPYIRKNSAQLTGIEITPGMSIDINPTKADTDNLIKLAKSIYPDLGNAIEEIRNSHDSKMLSAAEYSSANYILHKLISSDK